MGSTSHVTVIFRIVVLSVLFVATLPVSSAAICVRLTPDSAEFTDVVAQAELVFAGEFVERFEVPIPFTPWPFFRPEEMGPGWIPPTHVSAPMLKFRVQRWWKGGTTADVVVAVGIWTMQIESGPKRGRTLLGGPVEHLDPRPGERYLILAGEPVLSNATYPHPTGWYCASWRLDRAGEYMAALGRGTPPDEP